MKMKTSELSGPQLDWLVAKCMVSDGHFTDDKFKGALPQTEPVEPYMTFEHGRPMCFGSGVIQPGKQNTATGKSWVFHGPGGDYSPTTKWSQGGPIIEREKIDCISDPNGTAGWMALTYVDFRKIFKSGPTPLIAAMRCYVASKIGNEIEIPEEL